MRQKTLDKHSSNPGNTAEECSTTEESLKTAEECTTTEYHTAGYDTLGDVVSLHNDDTRGSDPEIQNLVTPAGRWCVARVEHGHKYVIYGPTDPPF